MKKIAVNSLVLILILIGAAVIFTLQKTDRGSNALTCGEDLISGKVQKINPADKSIEILYPAGRTMAIKIDSKTELQTKTGARINFQDIQAGKKVKVNGVFASLDTMNACLVILE